MVKQLQVRGRKLALISQQMLEALRNQNQNTKFLESHDYKKVKSLDQQIEAVLQDRLLSTGAKAAKYRDLSTKFLHYYEKAPETSKMTEDVVPGELDIHHPHVNLLPLAQEMDVEEEGPDAFQDFASPPRAQAAVMPPKSVLKPAILKLDETGGSEQDMEEMFVEPAAGLDAADIMKSVQGSRKEKVSKLLDAMQQTPGKLSWNPVSGEMIVEGRNIPNSSIIALLDYVSGRKPAAKRPASLDLFLHGLSQVSADLSAIPNKELKQTVESGRQNIAGQVNPFATAWKRY